MGTTSANINDDGRVACGPRASGRRPPQEPTSRDDALPSAPALHGGLAEERARLAHEITDDPVELVWVLHEHEVIPALAFLEDLDFRPPNLLLDPHLRLPWNDAHPAPDDQRGQGDPRDDTASVLGRVVVQKCGRILPWHLQVLLDDRLHLRS